MSIFQNLRWHILIACFNRFIDIYRPYITMKGSNYDRKKACLLEKNYWNSKSIIKIAACKIKQTNILILSCIWQMWHWILTLTLTLWIRTKHLAQEIYQLSVSPFHLLIKQFVFIKRWKGFNRMKSHLFCLSCQNWTKELSDDRPSNVNLEGEGNMSDCYWKEIFSAIYRYWANK